MLAFVALAQHGVLNDPGELENLKFADPDGAAQRVSDARTIGVGIKVRLHKKAVGDNGREALRIAVRTGEACNAHERGVIFDVGHANGHFDFDLVRRAMGDGLLPDIISSDLQGRMGSNNPVVDLPTTMTKFLHLGLSLEQVVAA